MSLGVSRALAEFVANTPAEAIPSRVRSNAVDTIIDAYATAHAGVAEPVTQRIRAGLVPLAGSGAARVVGAPELGLDPATAALFNASAAHALDFDSFSFAVSGFVGSAELFGLAALADGGDYSGYDIITAYVLGWEAAAALARSLNPEHYALGWHPSATMAGFATTLACCRLLGLDAERTLAAISAATSEASGIKIMIGNDINAYHLGKAGRNGVNAALLARAGFVGHPDPMESVQGFLSLFAGPSGASPRRTIDTLGVVWDMMDPGPVFKVYACCGLIHSGLDAVIALRDEHGIDPADVRRVEVLVHEYVPKVMHMAEPDTGYAAKFSIGYCIAAGLRDGRAGLPPFDAVDPGLVELGRLVEIRVHPDLIGGATFFEKEFTEVRIETSSTRVERRVNRLSNRGSGSLDRASLAEKFAECVGRSVHPALEPGADFERLLATETTERWRLWPM